MNPIDPNQRPPRRVLVTGGAGFIGSHLVERLLSAGDRVTVVDDCSTGTPRNLRHALALAASRPDDPLRIVHAELSAWLASDAAAHLAFDEIYHLAASVGVSRVVERPIETIETNVRTTIDVLRYAEAHGPASHPARGAAVFIASSSEVYGKSTKLPMSEDDDCVYGPTTKRRWSYAASKAIDEYLALAHAEQRGLPVVVARFFNTVGPRQIGQYGMVLPRFVASALHGQDLLVFGDGAQTRCFCDVRDSVPAIVALLRNPQAWGRVFNLGSDRPISIAELAESVRVTLGSRSTIRRVPYDEAYAAGFEDLRDRRPDLTRIRGLIGFSPGIPLQRTIIDVADHLRAEGPPSSPPDGGPPAIPDR